MAFYQKYKSKTKERAKPVHWEDFECEQLADYMRLRGLKFIHIANESGMRLPWGVIQKRSRLGYGKGFPDYAIVIPNNPIYSLLFIEMKCKKENGGEVSAEQKEWLETLNKCAGVGAVVCRGFLEARAIIDKALKIK